MFHQTRLRSAALALALLGLVTYGAAGGFFAREIVVEIAILAILAISLDVVAGYGGMVSLGHGAIMGIAAYGYAVLTAHLGWSALPGAVAGVALSAVFGTAVGWIAGRTSGIYFIMATLAFGQMVHTAVFKSRWLGGDDGMGGLARFDLAGAGIDMNDGLSFAIYAVGLVLATYVAAAWLLRSGFGRTLAGIRSNEGRMRALGVDTVVYRAGAMGFSGLLAGVAGILAAQHTMYISPELMHWTVSGEVLIVVILGGLGTLVGPLLGAMLFVFLKHEVSNYTDHWHMVVGVVLIAVVLAGGTGVFGLTAQRLGKARTNRRA